MNSMSSYVNNTVGHLNKEVSDSQKFQSAAGSLRLEIHPKKPNPKLGSRWKRVGGEMEAPSRQTQGIHNVKISLRWRGSPIPEDRSVNVM